MISDILEKDASTEYGDLNSSNIEVDLVSMPTIGANEVGNDGSEYAIEVKEKDDHSEA